MRQTFFVILIIAGAGLFAFNRFGSSGESGGERAIVVTTSHLGFLLDRLGGGEFRAMVLIPPGDCPGHYDMRPGDIRAMEREGVLFCHGWEPVLPQLTGAVGNRDFRVCRIEAGGHWLAPEVLVEGAAKMAEYLKQIEPGSAERWEENLGVFRGQMEALSGEVDGRIEAEGLKGAAVICSEHLKGFLERLGMEVVSTYGREEDMTPRGIRNLLEIGREKNVRLVVDNLQSGQTMGVQMAKELGAGHAVLSNFIGGFEGADTIESCIHGNIDRLSQGLSDGKDN